MLSLLSSALVAFSAVAASVSSSVPGTVFSLSAAVVVPSVTASVVSSGLSSVPGASAVSS